MKYVAVILADGFEEIEAVTVVDVLRRAGIELVTLGLEKQDICGSHQIQIRADYILGDYEKDWDMIVLPGGMPGSAHLRDSIQVRELLQTQYQRRGYLAAICAAPIALAAAECIGGRNVTCYPGFEQHLINANVVDSDLVHDGLLITGRAAGIAMEFSLKLVEVLVGNELADELMTKMQMPKGTWKN